MSVLNDKTVKWEARLRDEGNEVITTWDYLYKKQRHIVFHANTTTKND